MCKFVRFLKSYFLNMLQPFNGEVKMCMYKKKKK